jgi:hypothetical protein
MVNLREQLYHPEGADRLRESRLKASSGDMQGRGVIPPAVRLDDNVHVMIERNKKAQ